MLISIIVNIIISLIIIIIGHQIWMYLKDNYNVKQKMDLVGSQIYKYKNILNDIQKETTTKSTESVENISDYRDLKNDLEQFLQENI